MIDKKVPVCVSVINMKGGVGKTTIATLLSRYASLTSRLDLNVLAIDLDPQANLSQAVMRGGYERFIEEHSPSIVEIFKEYHPPSSGMTSPRPLDVADVVVDSVRKLQIIPSRFDFSNNLIDAIKPDERVLARLIADNFQDKDLIIIDCAPTESIFTRAAYHASRYILVPVKPEYFATIGFPLLKDSLDAFKSNNRGHQIDVIGVVINNWTYHNSGDRGGPERKRSILEIEDEAKKNGWHIFENQLPFSRSFPKMMRGDYRHPGHARRDFDLFAKEFFSKLEQEQQRSVS